MSEEIRTMLSNAAPAPVRPLDVAAIVSRGDRVRMRRTLFTTLAVPLIVGGLWAGASAGLNRAPDTTPVAPAGTPFCEWSGRNLSVFLTQSTTDEEAVELAEQVRSLAHVDSVDYEDFEVGRQADRLMGSPGPLNEMWEQLYSRWLAVRVDEASNTEGVVEAIPESPAIAQISDGTLRPVTCGNWRLHDIQEELEEELRTLEEKIDLEAPRRRAARGDG